MTEEARLVAVEEGGIAPEGGGWFVLNAKDAHWIDGDLGKYVGFEGKESRFPQLGININVMQPGESMTMYHRENEQEDFLVVAGEALLIVNGEERPLKRWDLFHCPAGVDHAIVGAGDGPCLVLAVGARMGQEDGDRIVYPADPVAQKHGAGPDVETTEPSEAYARFEPRHTAYQEGWLPD